MAFISINPKDHFNTVLYTGDSNASGHAITGVGFKPDLVWIKDRDGTDAHGIMDVVRGTLNLLESDSSAGPDTATTGLTSFDSDGFTVKNMGQLNGSGNDFVSWNWKAGGTGSSNTDGSITSTVSANAAAGFSIVKYTGTGSGATVGHGLGKKPDIIFTKLLGTQQWFTYNRIRADASKAVFLDNAAAESSQGSAYSAEASASVISYGTDGAVNGNGSEYIAYCFTSIPGFSQIGHYKGNGNANGQFICTGFKPAWTIMKNRSSAGNGWGIHDNKRNLYNVRNTMLRADDTSADQTNYERDYVSNGIKLRSATGGLNASNDVYYYMAFADVPFVTAGGKPCCAE